MNVILLLCFGTTLARDVNSILNLSEPAQPSYASRIAMNEGINPMRNNNQGAFFQPTNAWSLFGSALDHLHEQIRSSHRKKRDATGALQILTNHAQPIHADVKPDGTAVTEKPCPKPKYAPSHVENSVVFQVTAPEDVFYELKSLRKSWPHPNKLELVRSISRVITLSVLVVSAVVEFFPLLRTLYNVVYSFVYY